MLDLVRSLLSIDWRSCAESAKNVRWGSSLL